MKNLYWKIFLSFLLVMILTGVIVTTINVILLQARNSSEQDMRPRGRLIALAHDAAEAIRTGGQAGLKEWSENHQAEETQIPFLIVNEEGQELFERNLPPPEGSMAVGPKMPGVDHPRRRGKLLVSKEITGPDGKIFKIMMPVRPSRLMRFLLLPEARGSLLGVSLLVSGIVCFFLARYLTKPIHRLQVAGRQLADGELGVRVSQTMGRRRDEIAQLARDFDHMAERIEQLMETQSRLLRDVSHELRSPLARLQVAVGLARQRSDGVVESELDRIEEEAERLNELIAQVLSFARLESKTGKIELEEFDVEELLQSIAEDADFEGRTGNRRVELNVASAIIARGDQALLRSAIENVVRNAIQHTAADTSVEMRATMNGDQVKITVRDHGPGVPDDTLPHLFEPFYRVGEARGHGSIGGGIGLAIAQRAVHLHGGTIFPRNASDRGLIVEILLPGGVQA